MRRPVAALVVAALSFALVGCGGGTTTQADSTGTSDQDRQVQPAAAVPAPPEPVEDRSPVEFEPGSKEPFPDLGESMPEAIAQRMQAGQPMLLFFYDPAQPATDDLRGEMDPVLKEYRGLIDMLSYNVASGLSASARSKDPVAAEQLFAMESALGVTYTPYVILIDQKGRISWRSRGFFDRGLFEREILRATR